jgi:dTDP-4-amino-4,6-dideoxygalactose transaminase
MPEPVALADPAAEYRALRAEIDVAVRRVLESGRYVLGPEGEAFEREMAAFVGAAHAVGVNSGTDALLLALVAAGIGPGDEVVVPAFTFFASAEAVALAGATPVFADVEPTTFNVSAATLSPHIGPRTRAVVAVHLFGQCAPLDELAALCEGHHLVLVEDCAQAIGADDGGRRAGSVGDFGCFSFYPTKNVSACGDAGLVTCRRQEHADALRMLRHHGSREPYLHQRVGWNSRLDEVQAAILRVKLVHFERFARSREQVAAAYREALRDAAVDLPEPHGRGRHVFHQYTIQSDRRDALRAGLAAAGVATGLFYAMPLHRQPAFAGVARKARLEATDRIAGRVLSLPMHAFVARETVERIASIVRYNG